MKLNTDFWEIHVDDYFCIGQVDVTYYSHGRFPSLEESIRVCMVIAAKDFASSRSELWYYERHGLHPFVIPEPTEDQVRSLLLNHPEWPAEMLVPYSFCCRPGFFSAKIYVKLLSEGKIDPPLDTGLPAPRPELPPSQEKAVDENTTKSCLTPNAPAFQAQDLTDPPPARALGAILVVIAILALVFIIPSRHKNHTDYELVVMGLGSLIGGLVIVTRVWEKPWAWGWFKLIAQLTATVALTLVGLWLCSDTARDFRRLESGDGASLKVHSLIALSYKTIGPGSTIFVMRALVLLPALLSLIEVKDAYVKLKANR